MRPERAKTVRQNEDRRAAVKWRKGAVLGTSREALKGYSANLLNTTVKFRAL